MAYSAWDLQEAEHADALHAQCMRNIELTDDLKMRFASAFQQWIERNDVELEDPMFGGFAKRTQECLRTVFLGRINDAVDDACADYLPEGM